MKVHHCHAKLSLLFICMLFGRLWSTCWASAERYTNGSEMSLQRTIEMILSSLMWYHESHPPALIVIFCFIAIVYIVHYHISFTWQETFNYVLITACAFVISLCCLWSSHFMKLPFCVLLGVVMWCTLNKFKTI